MSIGELARRAGIRASAIRYYESIGLMPSPIRSSGRRQYDPHASIDCWSSNRRAAWDSVFAKFSP